MKDKKFFVLDVDSLVLGILSILTALFWYITLPSGILAIIFGVKSAHKTGSKIGKAGMILGIIGLALFAFNDFIRKIILSLLNNKNLKEIS